jgi:hypothetical protein
VRTQVEDAEDDVCGRAELHIAYRYIRPMYLLSICLLLDPLPDPIPLSRERG